MKATPKGENQPIPREAEWKGRFCSTFSTLVQLCLLKMSDAVTTDKPSRNVCMTKPDSTGATLLAETDGFIRPNVVSATISTGGVIMPGHVQHV